MIEVAGHLFEPNVASITCRHILEGEQALFFSHDMDGDLQILCGEREHETEDGRVMGLAELVKQNQALSSLPVVDPGFYARRDPQSGWVVRKNEDQD